MPNNPPTPREGAVRPGRQSCPDRVGRGLVTTDQTRIRPTRAEAAAGVDPALCEPITTVPEGWPLEVCLSS